MFEKPNSNYKMKRFAIITLLLAIYVNSFSQDIDFDFTVTEELEVCQSAVTFQVVATNNTGATIENPIIQVELPTGITYVPGSLVEITGLGMGEYDVALSSALQYNCSDIPVGDSVKFDISFSAGMSAVSFQESGGIFRNNVGIIHDEGFEFELSPSYNILYPAISILSLSPFSQTVISGDTTTRSYTIVNAGFGKTETIYITDVFTPGATLVSSNHGTVSGDTIVLSGSDFNSIGNGDGYLDNNESIVITETIAAYSCSDITSSSTIKAFWGCEESFDYSANKYAHVSVDFQSPSLKLISSEELNACFGSGVASVQELKVINTGNGIASDIQVDIYKSSGGGYDETIFSRFDDGAFVLKMGEVGSPVPITPTSVISTDGTGAYACLGPDPTGRVLLDIPDLAPGDTAIIQWDMYSCCINVCENLKVKGWKAEVDYTDVCAITDYSKSTTGQGTNSQLLSFFTETPTDIYDGQDETYTFIVSSFTNTLPENENSFYQIEFTLDDDLVYEGVRFHSNNVDWDPYSVVYDEAGNTVTALFNVPEPFTIPKSELELTLSGNCGDPGWKNIEMDVYYIPDNTCDAVCLIPLVCDEIVTTYLHCPVIECEGLNFLSFDAERISIGLPDNNLDGLADASGDVDLTKIKLNRAMVSDTILTTAKGLVSSEVGETWAYSKLISSNDHGANLSFVSAEVVIYDADTDTEYSVDLDNATTNITGYEQEFAFDLSIESLSAINTDLVGYEYANSDSIIVNVKYEVISSVLSNVRETTWTNEFYVSEMAAPSEADKKQCDDQFARITLIGYSWRNDFGNNNTVRSCSKKVAQNIGLSIGDCCSNYSGGNLFPYEYRHWGIAKEAKVIIPDNYDLVKTIFRQKRTRKTNSSTTQTISSIVPDAVSGDTLYYNLEQYYEAGAIAYSDDGFDGFLQIELAPDCDVPQGVYEPIEWLFNYQKSDAFGAGETGYLTGPNDNIRYLPSNLTLSSESPWVDANTREVQWNLDIQNASSSDADYTWVHIEAPENLTITEIIDASSGSALETSADLYLVGTVNDNSTKELIIKGLITNCDTLLFDVYSGYECVGYPADFESFTCNISSTVLYVEPKPGAFQVRLFSEPLTGDVCSPLVQVGLEISSVKIAHMYNMEIDVIVPDTAKIKVQNDSSYFKYNMDNAYENVANPPFIEPVYNYDINNYNEAFELQGIPGVLDLSNNRYRLKTTLSLEDGFVPGDYVRFQIDGQNACAVDLPTIYLDYDPNTKFLKDNTSGLSVNAGNTWSASWGDYDNDGFEDLYVPNKDSDQPGALYHNNGDGTMTKILSGAIVSDLGESVGATWGDYDNDGDLDLFVANNTYAKNRLYKNNGDGTFESIEGDPVIDKAIYAHSAAWGDYDKDGFLDLVVSDIHATHFNYLFHNKGDGSFEEVVSSVISQTASSGVGVSWADYDNDGDLDVFIANTNGENNSLYRNDAGVFTQITAGDVVNDGGHSIGGTWGDYDNDGDLDLFVTNSRDVEPNFFYENDGDGTFTKLTSGVILSNLSNSHGASWIDYDNDGDLDLLVANDQGKKNFLFSNNGDKTFTKITNAITEEESNSYGTAWADYDNDGDYDLHISNHGGSTNDFFINEKGSCNNYFGILLSGCNSNQSGIGTQIRLKANIGGVDMWQIREVSSQTSALGGQNSLKTIFGLKDALIVDSLEIRWPSGLVQVMVNQDVNQLVTINEECGSKICGTVFFDENGNDVFDPEEQGIPNAKVRITPGNVEVYTNNEGYYQVYVVEDDYTVELLSDDDWVQTYPVGTYSVEVDEEVAVEYCGNDFARTPVCTTPDLTLNVGATAFRRGLTNDITVTLVNEGAYAADETIELKLKFTENTFLVGDDWESIDLEEGYRTYTYLIDGLEQLSDTTLSFTDSVDVSAALDDVVSLEASLTYGGDECDVENNTKNVFDVVVGSIDPNDKLVLVLNKGVVHKSNVSDTIVYKIRFQNIGNYAARRVLITDTLSTHLDWSTVNILESTHPFTVSMNNGVLTWLNPNIELPDSTSDPVGSNGSVSFSVLPKQDCEAFTLVENTAYIQFDYNVFIKTNNTEIRVIRNEEAVDEELFLYPNPTQTETSIMAIRDDIPVEMDRVEVLDPYGHFIWTETISAEKFELNVREFNAGAYHIRAWDKDGNAFHGLLIVP